MPRCCIGLGGNVGDVAATFRTALRHLADSGVSVVAVSRVYCTAAVGPDAGDDFHNACAVIETSLTPRGLLDAIHALENAAGRVRSVRWGSRTLDVDILMYDELVLNDPVLVLPHPGVVYRRFVLDPLAEIAPQFVHPGVNRTIADLQQRLRVRPLPIRIVTGDEALDLRITAHLQARFPDVLQIERDPRRALSADATCLFRHEGPAMDGCISVALERQIASVDPLAAAIAAVTAMLDEPRAIGID